MSRARVPEAPPPARPVLRALELDARGWDLRVDRIVRTNGWPIGVAIAAYDPPRPDPGLARAESLLPRAAAAGPAWEAALRARCLRYRGQQGGRALLERALRLEPRLEAARLWLVEELADDPATLPRALALARRAAARFPGDAWAQAALAGCLVRRAELEPALALLDRCRALEPRRAALRVMRAEVLTRLLRGPEAVAESRASVRLQPRSAWARLLLARAVYNCAGELRLADRALDAALLLEPDLFEARVMKAEALRRQGRLREACRLYERIDARGVRYPRFNAWRGSLLRQLGRLREALKDLDAACSVEPDFALSFVERAHARLRLGEPAGALEDMRAAARLDSKHGWTFVRAGERDARGETAALLRRAAARLPRSPWPLAWLGEGLLRAGRPAEAERALSQALRRDPRCAWALAWRGEARTALGRGAEALTDLTRAARLDPVYPRARGRLGVALASAGRLRQALRALDAAIAREPFCAWTRAHRGEVLLLLGDPKRAVGDLDLALTLHRDYADALLWRALARRLLGGDGGPDLERAQALGHGPEALRRWLDSARRRAAAF